MLEPIKNSDELLFNLRLPSKITFSSLILIMWAFTGFNLWLGFCFLIGLLGNLCFIDKSKYSNDYFDNLISEYPIVNTNLENENLEKQEQNFSLLKPQHLQIINDAEDEVAIIKGAANVASGSLGENLRAILFNIINIENGLIKEPLQLSNVQRIFTYYIPAIIDLLNARGVAVNNNDEKRIIEIDAMVRKTKLVFDDYLLRLNGQDKKSVDIDLKLLEQSLAQEFTYIEMNKLKS